MKKLPAKPKKQETGNRGAAQALLKSEAEKWAILEAVRGLVRVRYLTPDFRIVWSNTDALPPSTDDAAPPAYCYNLVRGLTEPCPRCEAREALVSGVVCENRESSPADGRYFIIRDVPLKDTTGETLGVIHAALNVTEHKLAEKGLRTTSEFLHSLLENSPAPVCLSTRDGRIETVNQAWEKIFGLSFEQAVGRTFHDLFPVPVAHRISAINDEILGSGSVVEREESIKSPTGLHHFHTVRFPLQDASGLTSAVAAISIDVTARKQAEQELKRREAEVRAKSRQLSEMNTALRVLLTQREKDQKELEGRFVFNVKELVLPYVREMKGMRLTDTQMSLMEIIETHLGDIVAPFLRHVVIRYPGLTAKELQVASLVREGRANKEIAALMHVSLNTIEIHRYNIRKKMGLKNKKTNLRSYLLSLGRPQQDGE